MVIRCSKQMDRAEGLGTHTRLNTTFLRPCSERWA
jgi:hypothetical protein